jgi:hypothetical protein
MGIQYVLRKNNVVEQPDIYAAQVKIADSLNLEGIATRMLEQGSSVTKPDILMVLESAIEAMESLLLEGYRVNMGGLCDLYPTIRGKFNGITDTYDPSRHQVDVGATVGARVRKTIRDHAFVEKHETIKPLPSLLEFVNQSEEQANGSIATWSFGTINGYRLKFNPAAEDEGVFIVAESGYPLKLNVIQRNKPGQIVFQVGSLPTPGPLFLEVRTRYTPEGELRIGRFPQPLTPVEGQRPVKISKKTRSRKLVTV